MEEYQKSLGFRVVSNITQIPIIRGAVCAIDIDDTLFKSTRVVHHGRAVTNKLEFCHPDIPRWLDTARKTMDVIFITARDPKDEEVTLQQFEAMGLPSFPICFTNNKGLILRRYLQRKEFYTDVIFADDLDANIQSVKNHCPTAVCYRVDPKLNDKLFRRFTRRKSF
jgi:hypothetical protein